MTHKGSRFGFTPQEHRISALPATLAAIFVLLLITFDSIIFWPQSPRARLVLSLFGGIGTGYLMLFNLFVASSVDFKPGWSWLNAIAVGLSLGLITSFVPGELVAPQSALLLLCVITSAIVSERSPTYFLIISATLPALVIRQIHRAHPQTLGFHIGTAVIAAIVLETIQQLKNLTRAHIRRLESIAEFSRQITSTLDTKQVMTLLNAALQNIVEADTYFVGLREGDELRLELVYDDGEYFENQRVALEGTLSGWVLEHQQSLFLPDLQKAIGLPGIRFATVGKDKQSLSWLGVPMRASSVDGIMAVASYRPNAFDRTDLELLTTLSQHAALALDNAYRHAQVELQSRLDSLTAVYNHGYFIQLLQQQAEQAREQRQPLSLIMLDIDYFKQYNDTYGHLAGDEILISLCRTIKQHIKTTDAVGRWGGEEFAISLPNANMSQARQVAERIRQSMSRITLHDREQGTIPVPTVSQGMAVFPDEASDVIKLIDLADHRLYVAKERGRNQIEPQFDSPTLLPNTGLN